MRILLVSLPEPTDREPPVAADLTGISDFGLRTYANGRGKD
ncbi:MAG: hypothetical protein ACYSUV_09410 [Planctomycetota bacterium]